MLFALANIISTASYILKLRILASSQILAYLSGSSPHIMSGAVSALSLLIYNDPGLCFSIPDLMPSVFILLKSKALEVVKVSI